MPDPMTLYLWCAWLNIGLGGGALVQKKYGGARGVWFLGGLCWTVQMVSYFWAVKIPSLSGVAPTFGIAALVLCLWQGMALKKDYESALIRPRWNAFWLILLACGSLVTEESPHNSFMMNYIFAVCFFLSRPLSLGLTLYALGGAADCLLKKDDTVTRITGTSKDAAFLAAILFLGGEIAGCYWGFMGWGTTWRWSGNFYFSAMLFVLFMGSLHVPRSVFSSARSFHLGFFIPLTVIALAMTISKVVNL
jgi:hypothetical protein